MAPLEATLSRNSGQAHIAVLVLIFCCLCWGLSFPVMQIASARMAGMLPPVDIRGDLAMRAIFNGWRFTLAGLVYWLLTRRHHRGYTSQDWTGGLVIGGFFGGGMLLQLAGLRYTLPSVSAFLTAMAVIFAPLGQSILFRHRVTLHTWIAVVLAVVGVLILSQPNENAASQNQLAVAPPIAHLGEVLTVIGSILFTGQILAIGHYGRVVRPFRLTLWMFLACGLMNLGGGLLLGGWWLLSPHLLVNLVRDLVFTGSMVLLIFICSIVANHLMTVHQPAVSAATASVIYCTEPVFATISSIAFGTEWFTLTTALGGAVILGAVLIVAREPQT